MCKRMLWALVLAVLVHAPVRAQSSSSSPGMTADQVTDQLIESTLELQRMSQLYEQRIEERIEAGLEDARNSSETRQIGPVQLIGNAELVGRAAQGIQRALDQHALLLGPLDYLEPTTYVVHYSDDPVMPRLAGEGARSLRLNRQSLAWGPSRAYDLGRAEAERMIRESFTSLLLFEWSRGVGWSSRTARDVVVAQLLQSRNEVALACVQGGDVGACRTAMFADWDGTDESALPLVPLARPEWLGDQVAIAGLLRRRGGERPCFDADPTGTACALGTDSQGRIRPGRVLNAIPLPATARGDLVLHTIRTGGDDALQRMMEAPAGSTVGDLIEIGAGAPLDEVLTSWLASIGTVPERQWMSKSSMLWAGLFLLFSLGSTRWRLG